MFAPVLAQILTHPGRGEGSAPGFGVRVMGCARGRGRGVPDDGTESVTGGVAERGALPGDILDQPAPSRFASSDAARIRETVRRFSMLLAHSISA